VAYILAADLCSATLLEQHCALVPLTYTRTARPLACPLHPPHLPADRKAGAALRCHSMDSVAQLHVPYVFPSKQALGWLHVWCIAEFPGRW